MRDSTADLLVYLTEYVLSQEYLDPTTQAQMRVMLKVKSEAVRKASGGQRKKPPAVTLAYGEPVKTDG